MSDQGAMHGQYDQSMTINASPDVIFDFVADVHNLPKYLPTTKSAQPQQGDRVQVQGEAKGHTYNADGYLRADRDQYRLEWGADEQYYSGYLQITPQGDNASQVQVHLSFSGGSLGDDSEHASSADINEGMRKSLESIQNQVTGQGGKVEPSAAT